MTLDLFEERVVPGSQALVPPRPSAERSPGGDGAAPPHNQEVRTMDYGLKLIKVGGETRWAVHDGRRVVGKLFDTYAQAVAERSRIEAGHVPPPRRR
jgi:hypothetical protein